MEKDRNSWDANLNLPSSSGLPAGSDPCRLRAHDLLFEFPDLLGLRGVGLRQFSDAGLERGVVLRPLHDTIYWMPALNVTLAELDRLAEVSAEIIDEVLAR